MYDNSNSILYENVRWNRIPQMVRTNHGTQFFPIAVVYLASNDRHQLSIEAPKALWYCTCRTSLYTRDYNFVSSQFFRPKPKYRLENTCQEQVSYCQNFVHHVWCCWQWHSFWQNKVCKVLTRTENARA